MSEYKFTQDWFHWAPEVWTRLIPLLPQRKTFLEIGSFEGRSAVWIIENLMEDGGFIDCIDTWRGGEEHGAEDMDTVEQRFDHNTEVVMQKYSDETGVHRRVEKWKSPSREVLGGLNQSYAEYDFVYIGGSHIAKDVLTDACMAWPLLKQGGIMVFDDYLWGEPRDILHRPKPAVDAFVNIFAEEIGVIHTGYQLIIKKQ